ncbi:proline-rich protein 3-like [Durio zibethinus]|uniref:Proline-rich protein 3-like n=1 Tax=Durio zibethinus TaxID=66656 RepID=A0A6P5WQ37_DURZI|nr:proline-rich protein 3-like [Durio zibethinus]
MAFNCFFVPFSLLLLSLLVIAFAADYGNDSSKYGYHGIPADSPRQMPEGEAKPEYGSKPGEKKPDYGEKPVIYKPNPKEKPGYDRKPEGEEEPNYGTKQNNYKPEPEEKEKLWSIAVEGLVLCKSGSKHYPIQGALAKVTCQAVDEIGHEKTLPICSVPTDAKGYFFATVSSLSVADKSLKLKDFKAFLERSPLETCNVPTNVNKGITGAPLSVSYRVLNEKHSKLYSVGPFFFTSEPISVPNGY